MKKYRLKDEKYRKPAQEIVGYIEERVSLLEYYVSREDSSMRDRLIEYGVFDLWFEEVKPEFKSGDYIYITNVGEVFEIEDCKVIEDKLHWNTVGIDRGVWEYRFSTLLNNIRHATPEEIEEYNRRLPIIGGYRGELKWNYIIYGCKGVRKQDFIRLYEACRDLEVNSITIEGHKIQIETLQKIYEKVC